MKTSVEWLKEYSEIDVTTKELADKLTMTGSKVETIEEKGNDIKNVVIGKILEITEHPDADKLIVTKVNVGKETVQIVTGAKNVNIGDIVPVALDGAELPGGKKINKGMLRGVESQGMMCGITEIGLEVNDFPNQIEDGIMILPAEYEKHTGEDVVEILKLREDILDFEITSNRPDCLSIEGLGREVAASLGKPFKNPHQNVMTTPTVGARTCALNVDIEAPDLCYRYIARIVENVKIQESPEWMKRRLKACGIRSINNIVDITNYVMLELGGPMHAFDINSVEGKHIIVRRAKNGEAITTLDGEEKILNEEDLVIADEKKPIAIAGVMGGLNSEIEDATTTIVFESAVFNGGNIRKTAKKVGLRTEASSRYEKGLSQEQALKVINRAVELVKEIGAGDPVEAIIDCYPTKQEQKRIKLEVDKINGLLGTKISEERIIEILKTLEMEVENKEVVVPYFRQDIEYMSDLAEEVLRMYGYDKLESSFAASSENTIGQKNKKQALEDRIKMLLVDNGYQEMYAYSFISKKDYEKCNISEENSLLKNAIKVKNPLGEDFSIMRTTTLPSLLTSISTNYARKNKDVGLFEIGRTFIDTKGNIEKGEIPEEIFNISFANYGINADFYIIKNLIENILTISNIARYNIEKEEADESMHPGKTAKILIGKDVIAVFGEVHPLVLENYGVGDKVVFANLDLEKLTKYGKSNKKYSPIPKYPAVERDMAITIKEEIEVGEIEKIAIKRCKNLLESIEIFDIYRDKEKLGADKKSVAYSLKFRSGDKTLTDDEINGMMAAIISDLEKELGAELRK